MSESTQNPSETLPGDADQTFVQAEAQGDSAVSADNVTDPVDPGKTEEPVEEPKRRRPGRKRSASAEDDKDPVDPADPEDEDKDKDQERGPLSPAQFDDDGWGDTPVQMRG